MRVRMQAKALDIYSLGRMLLHMLTGYPPGHAVYRVVERRVNSAALVESKLVDPPKSQPATSAA